MSGMESAGADIDAGARRPGLLRAAPWAILFLGAATVRWCCGLLPVSRADGGTYLVNADQILAGNYFFPESVTFPSLYRTPIYPVFAAALLRLTGTLQSIAWAQHALGLMTMAGVGFLSFRIWKSSTAAWLSAAFAGLHFHFFYMEGYVLSETLTIALAYWSLFGVFVLKERPARARSHWFAWGGCAAAAALCRPEFVGLSVLYAAILFAGKDPRRTRCARALLYLTPTLLCAALWVCRNGMIADYWGLTPNSAITLVDGPAGQVVDWSRPTDLIRSAKLRSDPAGRSGCNNCGNSIVFELQKYRVDYAWTSMRLRRIALESIRRRPMAYLGFSLKNLRDLLLPRTLWPPADLTETIPGQWSDPERPALSRFLQGWGRLDAGLESRFLTPLFVLGVVLSVFGRSRTGALILLSFVCYLLGTYAFLSYGGPRYRIIVEPAMAAFAAWSFVSCLDFIWRRRRSSGTAGAGILLSSRPAFSRWADGAAAFVSAVTAAAIVLFGARLADKAVQRIMRDRRFSSAAAGDRCMALSDEGRLPRALDCLNGELSRRPDDASALSERGAIYFRMGEADKAVDDWQRARSLHLERQDLSFNLAVVDDLLGKRGEAAEELSTFLRRESPRSPVYIDAVRMRESILAERR